MVLDSIAIQGVFFSSMGAMAKVLCIGIVGGLCAKFPKESPLLTKDSLRSLSRLANIVLLPALIVSSLGAGLSVNIVERFSILILFALIVNITSYIIAYTFGQWLHETDGPLFVAIAVAIGSPNAVAMPLLVMQTMCDVSIINGDYGGSKDKCFDEATSLIFIYSVGWHILFWTYGFPTLEGMSKSYNLRAMETPNSAPKSLVSGTFRRNAVPFSLQSFYDNLRKKENVDAAKVMMERILLTPSMIAIYVGFFVGLIEPLQRSMFKEMTVLRPLGAALYTLGQPVVAINCLVMTASLAHVDFSSSIEATTRFTEGFKTSFDENVLQPIGLSASKRSGVKNTGRGPGQVSATSTSQVSPLHSYVAVEDLKTSERNKCSSNSAGDAVSSSTITPASPESVKNPLHVEQSEADAKTEVALAIVSPLLESIVDEETKLQAVAPSRPRNSSCTVEKRLISYSTSGSSTNGSSGVIFVDPASSVIEMERTKQVKVKLPQWRSIAAFCLCRLVLTPCVMMALVQMAVASEFIAKSDRLMQLIICIEAATPSAQIMVLCLNMLNVPDVGSRVAYMYVFMYASSIVTMTIVSTVTMYLFY